MWVSDGSQNLRIRLPEHCFSVCFILGSTTESESCEKCSPPSFCSKTITRVCVSVFHCAIFTPNTQMEITVLPPLVSVASCRFSLSPFADGSFREIQPVDVCVTVPHWWCRQHRAFWPRDPGERGIVVQQSWALAESWPVRTGWLGTRPPVCPVWPRSVMGHWGKRPGREPADSTSASTTKHKNESQTHDWCVFIVRGHKTTGVVMKDTHCSSSVPWTSVEWTGSDWHTVIVSQCQSISDIIGSLCRLLSRKSRFQFSITYRMWMWTEEWEITRTATITAEIFRVRICVSVCKTLQMSGSPWVNMRMRQVVLMSDISGRIKGIPSIDIIRRYDDAKSSGYVGLVGEYVTKKTHTGQVKHRDPVLGGLESTLFGDNPTGGAGSRCWGEQCLLPSWPHSSSEEQNGSIM